MAELARTGRQHVTSTDGGESYASAVECLQIRIRPRHLDTCACMTEACRIWVGPWSIEGAKGNHMSIGVPSFTPFPHWTRSLFKDPRVETMKRPE